MEIILLGKLLYNFERRVYKKNMEKINDINIIIIISYYIKYYEKI